MDDHSDLKQNDLMKVLSWIRNPTKTNLKKAEHLVIAIAGCDRPPKKEVVIRARPMTMPELLHQTSVILSKSKQ